MSCGSCGKKRGHWPGCTQIVPEDSRGYAARKTKDSARCPPHNLYKLASGKDSDGRKWRTDACLRSGCKFKHTYYV